MKRYILFKKHWLNKYISFLYSRFPVSGSLWSRIDLCDLSSLFAGGMSVDGLYLN